MFGKIKEELKKEIYFLHEKINSINEENIRLKEFYEFTQTKELKRLQDLVTVLESKNEKLINAKEVARLELEGEFNKRVTNIENEYSRKLEIEIDNHIRKIEFMEGQMNAVVDNRVNEIVTEIKLNNKELIIELKHDKEMMMIYKKKFEGGKIELGADEIKGMLLSANPNGVQIIDRMGKI